LRRLGQFDFPPRLNVVTRANFERLAATEAPPVAAAIKALLAGSSDPAALAPLSANPTMNAQMRTTCVATLLEAGTVENALPQTARATVNCRILPDEPVEDTVNVLARVIADDKVSITPKGRPMAAPPSPAHPEVMQAVSKLAAEMWPGVPVQPAMSAGLGCVASTENPRRKSAMRLTASGRLGGTDVTAAVGISCPCNALTSLATARDDVGFVVEPEPVMLAQHFAG